MQMCQTGCQGLIGHPTLVDVFDRNPLHMAFTPGAQFTPYRAKDPLAAQASYLNPCCTTQTSESVFFQAMKTGTTRKLGPCSTCRGIVGMVLGTRLAPPLVGLPRLQNT